MLKLYGLFMLAMATWILVKSIFILPEATQMHGILLSVVFFLIGAACLAIHRRGHSNKEKTIEHTT